LDLRTLYLQNVGQTSEFSMMFEVSHADGVYIYDINGKEFIDLNSGISVSNLGHKNEEIVQAIKNQADKHLHTMVYGEHIQSSQLLFAQELLAQLDDVYQSLYYLLTGSEAIEAAMKLAKKFTNRTEIIAAKNAYHGSTQGAESLRSDEDYKRSFYPLLSDINWIEFNKIDTIKRITERTACVIIEPVQAEAGVLPPNIDFLIAVQQRCKATKTLFILDEIQTGFGRTGKLFAHQKFGIRPDIICIGKAMGGGLPLSGIISSKEILESLAKKPSLGHITTFGGHPMSCASALASIRILKNTTVIKEVESKAFLLKDLLEVHPIVKEVRNEGLMMAVELTKRKYLKHVVSKSIELGVLVDYFLFNNKSFRIAPPLIISTEEIKKASTILREAFHYAESLYS